MTDKEMKQNAYNEARKAKIIESIKNLNAEDVSLWAEDIFSTSFDTPAQHIISRADAFRKDAIPF